MNLFQTLLPIYYTIGFPNPLARPNPAHDLPKRHELLIDFCHIYCIQQLRDLIKSMNGVNRLSVETGRSTAST